MRRTALHAVATVLCLTAIEGEARAQSASPSLQGEIPFDYSRGRNTSVQERPRPEYAPLGIRTGGFTIYPSLDLGAGYSDNVYSLPSNEIGDAYFDIRPRAQIVSNWSRHRLQFQGGGNFRRYTKESGKNEDGWYARAAGRAELGLNATFDVNGRVEQLYETRYSPTSTATVRSSAPYQVKEARALLQYSRGRVRLAGSGEFADYDFKSLVTLDGATQNQDNRDRSVFTGAFLAEYAVSPDMSVYGQISYDSSDYSRELEPGIPNRDGSSVAAIGGISLDLTALLRGRIGIGYMTRDYHADIYRNVEGFAAEAQIEYFPSSLTTVTLTARRRVDDATLIEAGGYFSTAATLRVDHELLRNLILNLQTNYEIGDYKGVDSKAKIFQLSGGGRYLISRATSFGFNLSYGERREDGTITTGPNFSEVSGGVSLSFHL